MSAEIIQAVHYAITGLIALGTLYHTFKKDKDKKASVCQQEFQDLKTKVAVLEERMVNETHLLNKLDDKLDEVIRDK